MIVLVIISYILNMATIRESSINDSESVIVDFNVMKYNWSEELLVLK